MSEAGGVLSAIVAFSLRFRGVVLALALLLLGYGLYSLEEARTDVFPEFAPPQAVVQTEAPGLSPEQVEVLVTRPIELVLNGLEGIVALRSGSVQGLSVITVTFRNGSSIFVDRQLVAERLAAVGGELPAGLGPPEMTPLTSSTSLVLAVGLTSDRLSPMELRTIADWTVRPRLLAVPGVAKVSVYGGQVRQLQVQVEPDRLIRFGLGIDDVVAAASRGTGVTGAGVVDTGPQRLTIRTEGQALTPAQLAKTVVAYRNGVSLTLGEVARVTDGAEPPIGGAAVMGRPGIVLMVSGQYRANTLEVTRGIDAALAGLRPTLAAQGVTLKADDLFRPAKFIETATGNVRSALLWGAALVAVVLALFLFDLRTAAISCTAIPLALLSAIVVLRHAGVSLNTMTLGGLAIAIGEVVDDAVIDVENVVRRLRENRERDRPDPFSSVILHASLEVRSAVVYATFAVVLVFVPVLTMTGVAGRLFAPLGLAYVSAVLASLAVALTVTPALCALLLRKGGPVGDPPLVAWMKARYRPFLRGIERHPGAVAVGVAVLAAGGLVSLPFLEGSFVPELQEGHLIVHMTAVPGTSIDESLKMGDRLAKALLALPEVRAVAQRVGRAEAADDIMGTHSSEIEVDLRPGGAGGGARAKDDIRAVLAGFPGANFSVNTFLTERMEETLSGYGAPFVVDVFGPDLDVLDAKAAEVARILSAVPGATDVAVQSPPGAPQVVVRLRRDDLRRWGLTPVEAMDAVRTAFQGDVVGHVYDRDRIVAASVILDPALRTSVGEIGALPLHNAAGTFVALRQVADVFQATGRYSILHEGARRVQAVTCGVAGRAIGSFAREARKRLAAVTLPAGTYLELAGSAAEQARSQRDLLVHAAIAGIGILLLLSMVTGSWRNFLLVLANLPFALVGGILVVLIGGGEVSLGATVGFVTVFGISLRNSIMLITHFEHLVLREGCVWGPETCLRGAEERLSPILMTAAVTAFGLLPLAIGSGAPGREIEGPMAWVILGGLVTSTALNLLVLPTLALRYARFGAPQETASRWTGGERPEDRSPDRET